MSRSPPLREIAGARIGAGAGGDVGQSAPTVVIRPPSGLALPNLYELWRHRPVLYALVWRNVTRRYRQTFLGPLWFILSPLVRMVVFSLVLGGIARLPSDGVPYPIFTYTALLPWELFASGVSRSTGCFLSYNHIISKVYFPRLLLPAAEVCTALVDFALSFGILLGMMAFYGFPFTLRLLILPLLLAVAMALALGLGLWLGGPQARYRDVSNVVSYLIQFWFYGTPVAYAASIVLERLPGSLAALYVLNPMFGVVESFRWALLGTGRPPGPMFAVSAALVLILLLAGAVAFQRSEHSIVDLV